jgi:hypothetical protein
VVVGKDIYQGDVVPPVGMLSTRILQWEIVLKILVMLFITTELVKKPHECDAI